ncbi:hypothetical protein Dimus_009360 [Dionaea muscipula]
MNKNKTVASTRRTGQRKIQIRRWPQTVAANHAKHPSKATTIRGGGQSSTHQRSPLEAAANHAKHEPKSPAKHPSETAATPDLKNSSRSPTKHPSEVATKGYPGGGDLDLELFLHRPKKSSFAKHTREEHCSK